MPHHKGIYVNTFFHVVNYKTILFDLFITCVPSADYGSKQADGALTVTTIVR